MTREEAIELAIKACKETWNEKTCKQIRKALEQEPTPNEVLDKIREEIRIASMIEIDGDSYVRLKNVYEIFDWYTKESEDI